MDDTQDFRMEEIELGWRGDGATMYRLNPRIPDFPAGQTIHNGGWRLVPSSCQTGGRLQTDIIQAGGPR